MPPGYPSGYGPGDGPSFAAVPLGEGAPAALGTPSGAGGSGALEARHASNLAAKAAAGKVTTRSSAAGSHANSRGAPTRPAAVWHPHTATRATTHWRPDAQHSDAAPVAPAAAPAAPPAPSVPERLPAPEGDSNTPSEPLNAPTGSAPGSLTLGPSSPTTSFAPDYPFAIFGLVALVMAAWRTREQASLRVLRGITPSVEPSPG